jgi:hypothetical protein
MKRVCETMGGLGGLSDMIALNAGQAAPTPPLLLALQAAGLYAYIPAAGKLWQESNGSRVTPAAADGDPVGEMAEYTGTGPTALADSNAARAVLRVRGGLRWLEVDGVDDAYSMGNAILQDNNASVSYFAAHNPTSTTGTGVRMLLSKGHYVDPYTEWGAFGLADGVLRVEFGIFAQFHPDAVLNRAAGFDYVDDVHNGTALDCFINGVQDGASEPVRVTGADSQPIRLFRQDRGPTVYYAGRCYGIAIGPFVAAGATRDNVRTQMGVIAGLHLNYMAFTPAALPTLVADFNPRTGAYQDFAGTVPVTADGQTVESIRSGSLNAVANNAGASAGFGKALLAVGTMFSVSGAGIDRRNFSLHHVFQPDVVARGTAPPGYAMFGLGSGQNAQINPAGQILVNAGGSAVAGSVLFPPELAVFGVVANGSSIQGRFDGAAADALAANFAAGTSDLDLFGATGDLTNYLTATVFRTVVCSPRPADADLAKLEEYLLRNYPPIKLDLMSVGVVTHGNSLVAQMGVAAIITDLGAGYAGKNRGLAGQTTPMMIVSGPADADPYFDATRYAGNVLVAWEITNDIRINNPSAAVVLANYRAYRAAREAVWGAGNVIMLDCLPATDLTVGNGKETTRLAVNSGLASEYSIATANPRVWKKAGGGLLVKVSANPSLTDPTNVIYYADGLHLTTAGYALVSADVAAAVLLR